MSTSRRPGEILIDHCADTPAWFTRETFREIIEHCFATARRITAIVAADNERSRKFMEGVGFILEGTLRRGFDGRRDALYYGMLEEDYKKSKLNKGGNDEKEKKHVQTD